LTLRPKVFSEAGFSIGRDSSPSEGGRYSGSLKARASTRKPLPASAIIRWWLTFSASTAGSQTTFLLGDEHAVLASATTTGSNIVRVGETEARKALQRGIREVCAAAGIKASEIPVICAGVAGAARDEVRKQIVDTLAELVTARIEIVGDMVIAHEAALEGSPGIVVLAGTGSMAYACDAFGRTARAGGWGYAISDEGSGHWIGVQAVAAVVRAHDSGDRTQLHDRIFQRWGLPSFEELVSHGNASPTADFSALFPDVLAAARAGDADAGKVLARAGAELAGLAAVVFRELWNWDDEVRVALAGGVLENSPQVRDSFESELKPLILRAKIELSTRKAVEAALTRARKLANRSELFSP
jgi:glucosamine kinase